MMMTMTEERHFREILLNTTRGVSFVSIDQRLCT